MIYLTDLKKGQTGKIEIFKPYGLTPKDIVDIAIDTTCAQKGSFSGRLDPMACGCINIYLDSACLTARHDDRLDKTYRFKMGIGIQSTSNDLLGIPTIYNDDEIIVYKLDEKIAKFLEILKNGVYIQKMPIHSSYQVRNVDNLKGPLWWWAKNNRIDEVEIPSFERKLYNFTIKNMEYQSLGSIARLAIDRISLISLKHNFNQLEIINLWKGFLNNSEDMAIIEMEISVSSGFYVRQLVEDIGIELGLKTITIEIERLSYL